MTLRTRVGADQHFDWGASVASTLEWWRDAGVDVEIDDAPRDWLTNRVPQAQTSEAPNASPEPVTLPQTIEAFVTWRVSDAAPDARWNPVRLGPEGPASAELMVLIEMPEREDVASGRLLSGACGRLFDAMLRAIGTERAAVHLAAMTITRPPAGRIAPEDIDQLTEVTRRHIELAAPKRLLLLGNAPARALLGIECMTARGALHAVNHPAQTIRAIASFHPKTLIEKPSAKAEAWKDLQLLMRGHAC